MSITDIITEIRLANVEALAQSAKLKELRQIASEHNVKLKQKSDFVRKMAPIWGIRQD